MELLLFDGFNGLIQGTFYALMALGLSLIISLNSVINFAHGGFMVVGAYLAFTLAPYIGFWPALFAGPILAGILGILVERTLVRSMYGRSDPIYSLLLTFGFALIISLLGYLNIQVGINNGYPYAGDLRIAFLLICLAFVAGTITGLTQLSKR